MKESGIGRENGLEAFNACECCSRAGLIERSLQTSDSQSKSTIVNIASSEESRTADDWFADSGDTKRYG